jgi:glucokinase
MRRPASSISIGCMSAKNLELRDSRANRALSHEWRSITSIFRNRCRLGGPVDVASGRIICSHQIQGWDQFNLKEWILSLMAPPVYMWKTMRKRSARRISLRSRQRCNRSVRNPGHGVGGGAVVEGKIYHGAHPGEVEIGHVRLDKEGRTVESCCSGWAVDRKILFPFRKNRYQPGSTLCLLPSKQAAALLPALNQGMKSTENSRRNSRCLAYGFRMQFTCFIHRRLSGGGLSLLGEPLRLASLKEFSAM